MLRLTPADPSQRFLQADRFDVIWGGGEANVAVSLANYGDDAYYVTKLPEHEIGQAAVNALRRYGVHTEYIARGGSRVGIYYAENGASLRPSKVIYDRAGSAIAEADPEDFDWDAIFTGADWFHWSGITPAISAKSAKLTEVACKEARKHSVRVSCDLNYRKKLWKYGKSASEVMPALVEGCDLILGNEEDAEKEFGIKPEGFDAEKTGGEIDQTRFESVCRQLMDRFPRCKKVAVTLRGSINANHNTWGGVLYDGKTLWQSKRYDITHIVDRVGGGDSFMGGLLYGLLAYDTDQQAIEFAAAASCLKHTIIGDYNRVTVAEVEGLIAGGGSGRVSR